MYTFIFVNNHQPQRPCMDLGPVLDLASEMVTSMALTTLQRS